MKVANFGTWQSNISAEQVAANNKTFLHTVGDGDYIYNVEMRPQEQARYVIVRYSVDGNKEDVLPGPYSARTKVHEYGGRSFTVNEGIIYFVNYSDQNLYSMSIGEAPVQITNSGVRFAELTMSAHGLIAIAELHNADHSVTNSIVLINTQNGEIQTLVSGADFYAFPTLSKDQSQLAWISWNHPNMPWDTNNLCVANVNALLSKEHPTSSESRYHTILRFSIKQAFYQPEWIDNDSLAFISDYNGWWNFYIWRRATDMVFPLNHLQAEFAKPLWNLGNKSWVFVNDRIICTYIQEGISKLAWFNVNTNTSKLNIIDIPFTNIDNLMLHNSKLYFIGASATRPSSLVQVSDNNDFTIFAQSIDISTLNEAISIPIHIKFSTPSNHKQSYAFYYPPANSNFTAKQGDKPPLIVFVHGGPTSAAIATFQLEKQFWTSRGFAIADINYGGSSGYGRAYRKALQRENADKPGYWGVVDVQDCIACVQYLIEENLVDPNMIVTRGKSAGGFTTLALMSASNLFKAGTTYYGVTDLLALTKETHKFESRYTDQLIGSLPEFSDLYTTRSPICNVDKIKVPLLVLQGSEDKVVLPNQAESIVSVLKQREIPVEYKLYPGEQHGFRKAENIIDALQRELNFYLKVFYADKPNEDLSSPKRPKANISSILDTQSGRGASQRRSN